MRIDLQRSGLFVTEDTIFGLRVVSECFTMFQTLYFRQPSARPRARRHPHTPVPHLRAWEESVLLSRKSMLSEWFGRDIRSDASYCDSRQTCDMLITD